MVNIFKQGWGEEIDKRREQEQRDKLPDVNEYKNLMFCDGHHDTGILGLIEFVDKKIDEGWEIVGVDRLIQRILLQKKK